MHRMRKERGSQITDSEPDRRSEYTTEVGDISNNRAGFVIRLNTTEILLVL